MGCAARERPGLADGIQAAWVLSKEHGQAQARQWAVRLGQGSGGDAQAKASRASQGAVAVPACGGRRELLLHPLRPAGIRGCAGCLQGGGNGLGRGVPKVADDRGQDDLRPRLPWCGHLAATDQCHWAGMCGGGITGDAAQALDHLSPMEYLGDGLKVLMAA